MTIAALAESACILLKNIDNLEQNKLNADNIEATYAALKDVKEVAKTIHNLCVLYHNRLPIHTIKQVELPKSIKELQLLQAQFTNEHQPRQVYELNTVSSRLNKIKTKIEGEWKKYAKTHLLLYFDLHEMVKSLPEVRKQESTLNGLKNHLQHDISVMPLTKDDLNTFDQRFEQYKQHLSTLEHLHPDVQNFLQKTNKGTATLADVTDEVLHWCRQGEHAKAFRIHFSY
jgi:tRNA uridine 5-carbamoylmethylation protein Kti12